MFENIEFKLGLHWDLNIIYVVDGYEAKLENEDATERFQAHGETIQIALLRLDYFLLDRS